MTGPASQDSVPAATIRPGYYVYSDNLWRLVADVATVDGRTVVTLAPLTYAADELVPVCAPLGAEDATEAAGT